MPLSEVKAGLVDQRAALAHRPPAALGMAATDLVATRRDVRSRRYASGRHVGLSNVSRAQPEILRPFSRKFEARFSLRCRAEKRSRRVLCWLLDSNCEWPDAHLTMPLKPDARAAPGSVAAY